MAQPTAASVTARTARFWLLSVLALFVSCGGENIRPDAAIPATESNYHSAEFSACGGHYVGIGVCPLTSGQDLNNVALNIQGYYQGTVRVQTTCRSDTPMPDSFRYQNQDLVPYYLTGPATESCLVSFVVSPEYPNEDTSAIVIHSFVGHLWVRVLDPNEPFLGVSTKVPSGPINPATVISVQNVKAPSVIVEFEDSLCHILANPINIPVDSNGTLTIPLKDLLGTMPVQTCVVSGVAFLPGGPLRIVWFLDGYDSKFIPLPVPNLTLNAQKKKLEIAGDNNTSVVNLDSDWEISNDYTFDFDPSQPHIARMLTVGGRSIVGTYDPKGGWSWMY